MCLSIALDRPSDILESGTLHGHDYYIIHNQIGHLCGYIKVDFGHPWHGKYNDIDVFVHGGITYAENDIQDNKDSPETGYWLGFDCAHCFDAPDPRYMTKYDEYPEELKKQILEGFKGLHGSHIRTIEFVHDECERIAIQANGVEVLDDVAKCFDKVLSL